MTQQKREANQPKQSMLTLQVNHDQKVQNPHLVEIKGNKVVTNSLLIAQMFGKRHKNVLQDIEATLRLCSKEFGRLNFQLSSYLNAQKKKQPMYLLTRDSAFMLIMSYTGPKAMQFKEAYIEEFDRMESELQNLRYGKHVFDLFELRRKCKHRSVAMGNSMEMFYLYHDVAHYLEYATFRMNGGTRKRYTESMLNDTTGRLWVSEQFVLMKMQTREAFFAREVCAEIAPIALRDTKHFQLDLFNPQNA